MHVPVAALTDSDHHQDRIRKHVRDLKRRSGLYICNTVSLSTICTRCNKDWDIRFASFVS